MAVIPTTPSPSDIDQSTLKYLCLVDRVSVSSFEDGQLGPLGNGHLAVYITAEPSEQQVIVLRFFDYFDEERATIVLVSRSKAWLQDERVLIFPRTEGGLWRVDCIDSDDDAFSELQDMLTYFIKYENRHQMRNTLAMVDPSSCQVTQVVANDVHLERTDSDYEESLLDEEDFIATQDEKSGKKLPVYFDDTVTSETASPSNLRKVKLLYQSGNAIVTGSDWIAHALVLGGTALAKGISNSSRRLEEKIEPSQTPLKLSEEERRIFEMIYSTTSTVSAAAADIVDKAVTAGVSSINSMVYTDQNLQSREPVQNASRHFGISALRATAKIIGGVASAASAVFASSREGAVQMIQKKYGADAGYIAEKTIGTGSNLTSMLVYFDARGISRRVVTKGVQQYNTSVTDEEASEIYEPETVPERQTIFENNDEWLEDQLSRTKTEKSDALITV